MTARLPCVEVDPPGALRASVIWMHGLGADGHDFEPMVPELRLPPELGVRFVFPHAPVRPVTLNGGMRMRAWFDVRSLERGADLDLDGIALAAAHVRVLIEHEQALGVAPERIVLAGFSQGGAMALHVGLRHTQRLAGVMGLSTFLPTLDSLPDERGAANAETPVFLAHGRDDPLIPLASAQRLREALVALGYRIEYREYPMAHSVCAPEVVDIAAWLRRVLAPTG